MASWPYNTAAWLALRAAKLSADPLCEVCLLRGRTVQARAVDHIKGINAGGEPFPPLAGLMSMCLPCHSYKTNHEDRPDRRRKLGSPYKGAGVDGGPVDPEDDWHAPAPRCGAVLPHLEAPGASEGRSFKDRGPPAPSQRELVPANHSQQESERWV